MGFSRFDSENHAYASHARRCIFNRFKHPHDAEGWPLAHHCPREAQVTPKQRKNIRLYSRLTMAPEPDVESMTHDDADRWLGARWHDWLDQGGPLR